MLPALYEIGEDKETATGVVYHFCDESCQHNFFIAHSELSLIKGVSSPIEQSQCDSCGLPLKSNADAIESGSTRPPTNQTAIQLLERAKQLVQGGWCQGSFKRYTQTGPPEYCLTGAISAAAWGEIGERFQDEYMDTYCYDLAETFVKSAIPGVPVNLVNWNDQPERTQADVLALLDSAKQLLLQDVPL